MELIIICTLYGFLLGMVLVAANPAPYFAALGLVLCSGTCCAILSAQGAPFLALVLFLVYLGGMLVVFGFSAALSADPHPETLGDNQVFGRTMVLIVGTILMVVMMRPWVYDYAAGVEEFPIERVDMGVVVMYSVGGALILFCAWVLFLTLMVVFEVSRGRARGALRAP
uniref:NADH-ubiquinone oxidoreductase chain 6 n=1 Tax=Sardinella lemuru TaxID=392307 RepID=A0A346TN04_9TELE|nr:NADH dehydrogenase subunit 6 [Sardinella lemuru]ATE46672.1 NADH dehydrogenase subunit 6 [Sardinella lemuru]AXU40885.1 NADH dehydrogenase subunit 6 [Sardinella lemuru]